MNISINKLQGYNMAFKAWLQKNDMTVRQFREQINRKCTIAALYNYLHGTRVPRDDICDAIENVTKGEITRRTFREHYNNTSKYNKEK